MAKKVRVNTSSGYNKGSISKKASAQVKEPTYEFTPSEFDEKEYIKTEIINTKATLIFCAFSLITGFAAACLSKATGQYLFGIVLMGVVLAGMGQFLKLIHLDTSSVKPMSMVGNYVVSIFLMLCIWTLMINPPFA